MNEKMTGRPSIDRPWMKYYPEMIRNIQIPECTLWDYLKSNCPGEDVAAIHYYGNDILWSTVFEQAEAAAYSLKALGFGEGDQIPVFLRSVPEFVYLLLAAEKIGASILCRDNTLEENVEAVAKSGARAIFAHDYLSQEELEAYLAGSNVKKVIILNTCNSCSRDAMPDYVQKCLDSNYPENPAHGRATMDWEKFLSLGENYLGRVEAPVDVDRPLFRAYTSGSTGPSKQVIHSAHTMIGVIHQMNFYAGAEDFRPTWLVTILPPALVAVVVSMILMPMASNRLLILDPFCAPEDVDLEMMRYRPNGWPIIPMFFENVMRNGRVPEDYDMSHLLASGVGCESYNNKQIQNAQKFLNDHNCHASFSVAYGCSEAGSNMTLPDPMNAMSNGNVGIPLPLTTISIFRPGTQEELGYDQQGEICISGPGVMLGYDNPEATAESLQTHEDGRVWLHTGDIGYMNENGNLFTLTRGEAPRYGGGDLATLPMENCVADANIDGIDDEFFVVVPDDKHDGYYLPYLYLMLEEGYDIEDVEKKVRASLDAHMQPAQIIQLPERPFFHFKTNRIGLKNEVLEARKRSKKKEKAVKKALPEGMTGRPSIDRPWMRYYPEKIRNIQIPECTLLEYLKKNCPGEDVAAIHYYGNDILWSTVFEQTEAVARSLRALGFEEGDQIPVFLRSVPEFIYMLLAAEKIGASILCRDNTLEENVEAVAKSGARAIFAHDYLAQDELDAYLAGSDVRKVIILDTCNSGSRDAMPDYVQNCLDSNYPETIAQGPAVISWDRFLTVGKSYIGKVDAAVDIDRPLFRAYTSGSTGPSKQVIHSAHTMIGVIHQMNFYAGSDDFRPTWMVTILPPALVAVVVSMLLMPMASNKLLILDPFCAPEDVDLEMMRYRPNAWPIIPLFFENVMKNGRVPEDYDMSHLLASGVGCESYNNKQIRNAQKFLNDHNCNVQFSVAYGCSEAGSNMTFPSPTRAMTDGNVGIPLPLTTISVFKPGTQEELTYNQQGEICISGPGVMLGYDNPESTAESLQMHEDGKIWLHTGDIGYMSEEGNLFTLTRGKAPRFGGGDLATLPMENCVADANIDGIDDEFFVVVPDDKHAGYFLPYLYVMLEDGYSVEDIEKEVRSCLDPHMQPVQIIALPERPFFHFKTNRIGLKNELLADRKFNKKKEKMEKYA